MWPRGRLAESHVERSRSAKEITKILVKTKLLGLVSDELRHIIGTDTTRRGIFELFDLFQHRALNKRLFHILAENLLVNLFELPKLFAHFQAANNTLITTSLLPNTSIVLTSSQTNLLLQQQLLSNPFKQLVRLHLSKSTKVKAEWKQFNGKQKMFNSSMESLVKSNYENGNSNSQTNHRRSISTSLSAHALSFNAAATSATVGNSQLEASLSTDSNAESNNNSNKANLLLVNEDVSQFNMTRSKSLFNEIKC